MSRKIIARASAGLLCLMLAWFAYTQTPNQPPQLKVNKVKDGLFEIEGDGGNVGVLVTNEGVVLIDDKYERDAEAIQTQLKTITNLPVKYVINTHYHEDHSGGNAKLISTAEIISTAMARKNIVDKVQTNASVPVTPARITFTQETSVFVGGKEVRARHFGRGHTNGDAVVYFPDLRTIHTGDLMAGTSPLIDYPGGGSVVEWTKTLDEAMKLDFDTVIPGHGAVTNKAGLLTYRNNVEKLRNDASAFLKQGKSQEELAKYMETQYKWAPGSLQQLWAVPGMYKELK